MGGTFLAVDVLYLVWSLNAHNFEVVGLLMMVGLAVSAWIALIATPFLFVCIVGWVFQYYRGYFVR